MAFNNKKGFTLVELLAVIVVLAVIILIAMPSVMSAMEKARKNSFAIEANEVIKVAQSAYASYIMNNGGSGHSACINFDDLITYGYLDKKDSTQYKGSVKVEVNASGQATYTIWLSNGSFMTKNATTTGITGPIDNTSVLQAANHDQVKTNCNGLANIDISK